jgi:Domain of unknown function DUF29
MTTQSTTTSYASELGDRPSLYEQDFCQWTQLMADLLRTGRWQELDIENIVEEIESLGRSDRRELRNRVEILLMHLLKWSYQRTHQTNSWRSTITEQRIRVQGLLEDSPSLKPFLETEFAKCYQNARALAAAETGLSLEIFPEACPYLLQQVLEQNYLPE